MYQLPDPQRTRPAGQPTSADRERIRRLVAAVDEIKVPTSYDNPNLPSHKDGAQIGDTPPVPQPDSRIVPAWALGIAVASIGVGAGITGAGCGIYLVLKGLAAVTLNSVLMVTLPLAGLAMVATAVGGMFKSMRHTHVTNIRNGPTYEEHHTTNTKAVWSKTINKR